MQCGITMAEDARETNESLYRRSDTDFLIRFLFEKDDNWDEQSAWSIKQSPALSPSECLATCFRVYYVREPDVTSR